MTQRAIAYEIRELIFQDTLRAIERVRQGKAIGATIGWDDAANQWWAACDDCGIARHYTSDLDQAAGTISRHNATRHMA